MAGAKKISGTVRVEDPKGYRTPSKIVAARTGSTNNGGLPRVVTHEPDLSPARSLQRSLGLLGRSVDNLGESLAYRDEKEKAEEERQKRKAEYEAEKARNEARKQDYKDAQQYATDNGYQLVETAQNHFTKVLSEIPEGEFNPISFMNDTVIPYVDKMKEGASDEYNRAMSPIYNNIRKFGYQEAKKHQAFQLEKTFSTRMLGAIRNEDASAEDLSAAFGTMKERYIEGGGSEEGFAAIRDNSLLTEAIQWRNAGNTEAFDDRLDRLYESGLLDLDSPQDLEVINKLDMLEAQAEEYYNQEQQRFLDKVELLAREHAESIDDPEELKARIEEWESVKSDSQDPYKQRERDIYLTEFKRQQAFLQGKSGKYKELIDFASSFAAGKLLTKGIGLDGGASGDLVSAAKIYSGGKLVAAPVIVVKKALSDAVRDTVLYLQRNNIDPDINNDASREIVLKRFQEHLGKFTVPGRDGKDAKFSVSDPMYIEDRPPEKWTPQYIRKRQDELLSKVKSLSDSVSIVDAVNEVIPETVPNYQDYRSTFYQEMVNNVRLERAKQDQQRFIQEARRLNDKREAEMAGQNISLASQIASTEEQQRMGGGLGAIPLPDYIFDPVEEKPDSGALNKAGVAGLQSALTYTTNALSPLGMVLNTYSALSSLNSDEIENAFPYSDDIYAAATMALKAETGNEDPFAGKTREECIEIVEALDREGKIKEVKLKAYRDLMQSQHRELNQANKRIKNLKAQNRNAKNTLVEIYDNYPEVVIDAADSVNTKLELKNGGNND